MALLNFAEDPPRKRLLDFPEDRALLRFEEDESEEERGVLSNFLRGIPTEAANVGADVLSLAGLLGVEGAEERAQDIRTEAQEFYDPQGVAGVAGRVAGGLVTLGPLTAGGGAAAASRVPALAKAAQSGSRTARIAARSVPFAPVDFALGAARDPENPIEGGAASVGLGVVGSELLHGLGRLLKGRKAPEIEVPPVVAEPAPQLFIRPGPMIEPHPVDVEAAPRLEPHARFTTLGDVIPGGEATTLIPDEFLVDDVGGLAAPQRRPDMRTILRVEHPDTGQGPYDLGGNWQKELWEGKRSSTPSTPSSEKFGFDSQKNFERWFSPAARESLASRGFKLRVYEVPQDAIRINDGLQTSFDSRTAQLVDERSLVPEPPPPGHHADEVLVKPTAATGQGGFVNSGAIMAWVKRNFATGGNIPRELWNKLITRDGGIGASERELVFNVRKLMQAAGQQFGLLARFRLPEEVTTPLNAFLRGQAPIEALPDALRPAARNIRNHVDALSQKLIDSGAAEGKMAVTIESNMGVYLTRAYEQFENPSWAAHAAKHPSMEPVRQKVMALLRSQNPELTAREAAGDPMAKGELQGMFNDLLAKPEEGPFAILARRPGLAKNLSILERRKEIAPEIRALWGEVTNPLASYARSVQRMASLLETHKSLVSMRDAGLGRFFFTPEMRGLAPEATAMIGGENSEVLKPLNGLWTYPEIAQSLRDFTTNGPIDAFTRAWIKVNAVTKFSKVILSHVALLRNVLGNIGFAATQGHWRAMKAGTAARALMAEYNPFGLSGTATRFGFNERGWQQYVLELQRLGVIGDAARAHELQDIMQEISKSGHWLDELGGNIVTRLAKKVVRGATEVYRAGDDVWKIFAYENELARYRAAYKKAGTAISDDALKARVAENVRLTYPTYSNIPRAIRALRRFPLLGPFVSFPWEVYRTSAATIGLAFREMADPALASVGRSRLATAALGIGVGLGGVAAFTKHINGITEEREEAMRRFLPPWSQNSTLAYLNRDEDGNARVIDLSYTDPYSYMRDGLTAALRGEDWHAKIVETFAELFKPFASPEILTAKSIEAIQLWQQLPEGMPLPEKIERVGNVLYEAFEPGSVNALMRLKEATQNPGRPYDQKYDPEVERLVNLTGTRVTEVNPAQALVFKAREYADNLSKARREELRVARRRLPVGDDELMGAQSMAEQIRSEAFETMRGDIEAARVLGKSDFEIRRALTSGGLPAAEINAVLLGLPRMREPTISIEPGDPMTAELIRRQMQLQLNQFRQ